jgi:hypothetical protein
MAGAEEIWGHRVFFATGINPGQGKDFFLGEGKGRNFRYTSK